MVGVGVEILRGLSPRSRKGGGLWYGVKDLPSKIVIVSDAANHGHQCGFRIQRTIMTLKFFLEQEIDPKGKALREILSGHLYRSTGDGNIITTS